MRTHQHPPKPVTEMQQVLTILSTFHAIALSTVTAYMLRDVQNSRKQQPHLANEDIQKTVDATTCTRPVRAAASKAIQQMKEWNRMLGPAPEDV